METKIPPPIVTLIFIFLISLSNRLIEPFSFEYQLPVGILIVVSGLAVLISAARVFKQLETTINPMDPSQASKLAIIGPFKYTRNPMYLGMSIMLLGFGIIFGGDLKAGDCCFPISDDVYQVLSLHWERNSLDDFYYDILCCRTFNDSGD